VIGPTFIAAASTDTRSSAALSYSAQIGLARYAQRDDRSGWELNLGYDSRARTFSGDNIHPTTLRANYITIYPAVNVFMGGCIGVNIGIPLSATSSEEITSMQKILTRLDRASMNVLIEPKIMLAMPIKWFDAIREIAVLWISFGYPINGVLNQNLILNNSTDAGRTSMAPFRLFEFGAGLGYAFDLYQTRY
jgi:hypothetical protein